MYAIMRIEKRSKQALYGLQKENNRSAEKQIELVASDIDWSRTKDNIYLKKCDNWNQYIKKELKKNGIDKTRKDAILVLDGLYTASPEFFENKSEKEIIEYFKQCLTFHEKNYGQVFNAVIHADEKNLHLHCQSIPFVFDDDKTRLSASEIMGNKTKYHKYQDDFYNDVGKKYGLERGEVHDNKEKRKHLEVLEYKAKMQKEEIEKLNKENEILEKELRDKVHEINTLKNYMEMLKSKIEYIKEWLKTEKNIDDDLELQYQKKKQREQELGR